MRPAFVHDGPDNFGRADKVVEDEHHAPFVPDARNAFLIVRRLADLGDLLQHLGFGVEHADGHTASQPLGFLHGIVSLLLTLLVENHVDLRLLLGFGNGFTGTVEGTNIRPVAVDDAVLAILGDDADAALGVYIGVSAVAAKLKCRLDAFGLGLVVEILAVVCLLQRLLGLGVQVPRQHLNLLGSHGSGHAPRHENLVLGRDALQVCVFQSAEQLEAVVKVAIQRRVIHRGGCRGHRSLSAHQERHA